MTSKSAKVLALAVISGTCFGIFFTSNYSLLGFLLGFLLGLFNIQWLFRDSKKVVDKKIEAALKRYVLSLFSRLGIVTMLFAVVGRYKPEWLFFLALGLAAGVIIPLILAIRQNLGGRG